MRKLPGSSVVIISAILFVGLLIVNGRPQPPQPSTPEFAPLLFPGLAAEEVIGIELRFLATGTPTQRVVFEDGEWQVFDQEGLRPANDEVARIAVELVRSMPIINVIDRGERSEEEFLTEFGFLPIPQYVVRFQVIETGFVDFAIGDPNPGGTGYYVLRPDRPELYIVPLEWVNDFVNFMQSLEAPTPLSESTGTAVP